MEQDLKKLKFIELKAEERSLAYISEAIDVSKPTLIKWSRELHVEIFNQKSLLIDSVKEEINLTKKENLLFLKNLLSKVDDELSSRSFTDVSTDKLLKLRQELRESLQAMVTVSQKELSRTPLAFDYDDLLTEKRWEI